MCVRAPYKSRKNRIRHQSSLRLRREHISSYLNREISATSPPKNSGAATATPSPKKLRRLEKKHRHFQRLRIQRPEKIRRLKTTRRLKLRKQIRRPRHLYHYDVRRGYVNSFNDYQHLRRPEKLRQHLRRLRKFNIHDARRTDNNPEAGDNSSRVHLKTPPPKTSNR